MRVLIINDFGVGGGCEQHVSQLVSLLGNEGHVVELLTAARRPEPPRHPLAYISNHRDVARLRAMLASFRPEVVHLHNIYHLWSPLVLKELARWKRASGGRVVMTAHDFHLVCPNPGFNRFKGGSMTPLPDAAPMPLPLSLLLRSRWDHRGRAHSWLRLAQHLWHYRLCRRAAVIDRILAPSRVLTTMLQQAGLHGVHLPHPVPAVHRIAARRPDDRLRLVFVGRLEPEKGLIPFLRAAGSPPAWTLTVVGDGSERHAIERAARERQLAVGFRGQVEHDQALLAIAGAHVLILPSRCHENAPLVLLEALALGTNVLVTDRGGMRETIETAGVGFRFDPDRPETLRAALQEIERARLAKTLNDFTAPAMLRDRAPRRWIVALLAHYGVPEAEVSRRRPSPSLAS